MFHCVGCTSVAGCKPNCCTQPRAAPWGNDVALIKVSRSVRATCFMRGNAPCGVKGVMGYALSARGIFAQAQKCRMYQSRSTFPQGVALGYGQHLGLQPAPIIYRAFVQIGSYKCTFGCALEKAEICFLARVTHLFPRKTLQPSTNLHKRLYSNGLRVCGLHLKPVTNDGFVLS